MKRFWSKVDKRGKCWIWTASTTTKGYGQFKLDGKMQRAHRISWSLSFGAVPRDLQVLHSCDNPRCVKPDHLFIGTNDDNMKDMAMKGRAAALAGADNGRAKLTPDQVAEIRRRRARGSTLVALAREFHVSFGLIGHITRNEVWVQS